MKEKGASANVTDSKTTFAGKTIAIATLLVAVLSFGALGAYGTGDADDSGADVRGNDAVVVNFFGEYATVYPQAQQPLNLLSFDQGMVAPAVINQEFTFEVVPDDDYVVTGIEVTDADGASVEYSEVPAGRMHSYIIAAADVRDGLTVTVSTGPVGGGSVDPDPDEPKPVIHVITPSADKIYDGEPLTAFDEVQVFLPDTEEAMEIEVIVTGSQTEPGTSDNTFEIEWGNADPNNYEVTSELGTLTVFPNEAPISIIAPTASKNYDGTPLIAEAPRVIAPEGVDVQAKVEGRITDAGTVTSTVTAFSILDAQGNDIKDTFDNIQIENGTLTVNPAPLTITTPAATKAYDGQPLTASAEGWIKGFANGETATATITGSQTEVGASTNTYAIDWNGTANASNYRIVENLGLLEVTPVGDVPDNNNSNNGGGAPAGGGSEGGSASSGGGGAASTGTTTGATAVSSTPGVSYTSETPSTTTGAEAAASNASNSSNNPVDTVAEAMQNTARGVVGEDPVPLTAPVTAELDENGTPLGAFDEPADNWVRWYVVVGIIATAMYGLGVLMRRRNFTKGLEDQENSMLGLSSEQGASSAAPADAVVRGA